MMLDIHEPVKDTGLRRTYPNVMTREGARGGEWDAWGPDGGNPPSHTTILPFTVGLSGPYDYTPGIFDLLTTSHPGVDRVRTTLAKQLALYVILYSPLQMAADLPESYVGHPAYQFIRDVPVDWETTRGLGGEIGAWVAIARQERGTRDWYVGAITNELARQVELPLDFLGAGYYCAEIYRDSAIADYATNPFAYGIERRIVDRDTTLVVAMAAGGGQAVRLTPAERCGGTILATP
jgi:alpha-glucosidase